MEKLTFTPSLLEPSVAIRSPKENLIAQIVDKMTGDKKQHAKLIALWSNRYHIDEMDLHALLAKAKDPSIRNFTAFVRWSIKDSSNPKPT